MKLYNLAYFAGMVWFAWWALSVSTAPGAYDGGFPVALNAFGIGLAPMALLWIGKRLYTGKWIS